MRPMMIADLREKKLALLAWCLRCQHHAALPLSAISRLADTTPVPTIGKALKCSKCGSRDIETRPDWQHGLGQVSQYPRDPSHPGFGKPKAGLPID